MQISTKYALLNIYYVFINALMLAATLTYLLTLPFANECAFTPEILTFEPHHTINQSNNLIRETGGHQFSEGQPILIKGRILDSHCSPVPEAIIDIWQKGPIAEENDENFKYSGRAITNNLGEYFFLTVMPAATDDSPPYINFKVHHQDYPTIHSIFYFENFAIEDIKNFDFNLLDDSEKKLLIAKELDEDSEVAEQAFEFDITLRDYDFYRKF